MANIDALLGLNDTQALADRLRGRDRAAQFFGMSTIEPLSRAAQAEQQNVQRAAQERGGLERALRAEQMRTQREQQAQAERMAEGQRERDFRAAEAEKDREARAALEDAKAARKGSGLTAGQMSSALRNLGKEVKPVEDVIASVEDLDRLLTPFYGQDDIPGLGRIEGQQNLLGKTARIFGPKEGENISQAVTKLLRSFIKESAGLAQTLSETQGVIQSYGLDNLSEEETFLRVYPEIKEALRADLDRVQASYLPEVVDQFKGGYTEERPSVLDYQPQTLEQRAASQPEAATSSLEEKRKRLEELRRRQRGTDS